MTKLLISTGWYADRESHSKYCDRAARTFQANWLQDYWKPYIERFVIPSQYFCYVSNCEIFPDLDGFEYVVGLDNAKEMDHRHDFHAGVMMGLQYAHCNGCDFLYIEQDCFVYGLDIAIEWAQTHIQDKLIIYGWEPWCFNKGWAEQSLMYVSNIAIPPVLWMINNARVHEDNIGIPEKKWHESLFGKSFLGWPFGYGRKAVRDWDQEVFFKQQLTDEEIEKFLALL